MKRKNSVYCLLVCLLGALAAGCGNGSTQTTAPIGRVPAGNYTGTYKLAGSATGSQTGSMVMTVTAGGSVTGTISQTGITAEAFEGVVDASGNTSVTYANGYPGTSGSGALGIHPDGHCTGTLNIFTRGAQVATMSVDVVPTGS